MATATVALGVVAAVPRLGVAVGAEGVTASFDQIGTIAGNSLIQRERPDPVRGRVFAAYCTSRLNREHREHRVHRGRLHP